MQLRTQVRPDFEACDKILSFQARNQRDHNNLIRCSMGMTILDRHQGIMAHLPPMLLFHRGLKLPDKIKLT